MNDDITIAQVKAGEDVVIERLRQKGLLLRENETLLTIEERQRAESVAIFQCQQLEHSLATTFTTMQRERVPGKRQELWAECLRLAKELEGLNK